MYGMQSLTYLKRNNPKLHEKCVNLANNHDADHLIKELNNFYNSEFSKLGIRPKEGIHNGFATKDNTLHIYSEHGRLYNDM